MVFKPNYNLQRVERNRAKQAKNDAKLREREELVLRRKREAAQEQAPADGPPADEPQET
jgi:hypothetical protein